MLDSLFDDVKRMNKRQVKFCCLILWWRCAKCTGCFLTFVHLFSVYLPGFKLWHDSVVGVNDMERSHGGYWERESDRRGSLGQYGARIP